MSRGYYRRGIFCIAALVAIYSQIGLGTTFADIIPTAVGDDLGVTISGPESISSRDQVELNVTLSASAGRLDEDGLIKIAIPKSIVNNKWGVSLDKNEIKRFKYDSDFDDYKKSGDYEVIYKSGKFAD